MVAPEVNKIKVFNKGIPQGLIISRPLGGQTPPRQKMVLYSHQKKAQKKAKKNIISETMNNKTPCLKPC